MRAQINLSLEFWASCNQIKNPLFKVSSRKFYQGFQYLNGSPCMTQISLFKVNRVVSIIYEKSIFDLSQFVLK